MINAKVVTESSENFNKVKASVDVGGKGSELVEELYTMFKAINKHNPYLLLLAIDKFITEVMINEEA